MKVHLVKSEEVDKELFTRVVDFLQALAGPIEFCYNNNAVINFNEDDLYNAIIQKEENFNVQIMQDSVMSCNSSIFPLERNESTWKNIFNKCNKYRRQNDIEKNEFVILLTGIANENNWFACLDEEMPFNGFIHTSDWDYYINCSAAFPIAYEVIALLLQKHMFNGHIEIRKATHVNPIGCVNDMCIKKKEIILKLRTADICSDCMELIKGKITMPELYHALNIMGSLREKMLFAQNFKQASPLSKLTIDNKNKLFLPDFGNIEIKLRPLEKALYFLFLRYPNGIYHSSLSEHRMALYDIYSKISTMGDLPEMQLRIDDMVNTLNDSASQKMSRIKRVFEDAIGNELAANYYIKGESGQEKKISLDRSLVTFL